MFIFSLGGGDSDAEEGVDDDDDNLEMTKYDEGEVAVNEEDELAVSSCCYSKGKVVAVFLARSWFLVSKFYVAVLLQVRMFMKPNRETRTRTLGEIINERMTEKKTEIQSQFSDGTEMIKVNTRDITQTPMIFQPGERN